ncbi:hypothetical protein [Streptomyces avermitilis]|uniref:hypothetical protein n=1 Tax=Streptomyces avermitilis TaxID=33903 RepID=UPI0033B13701
MQALLRRGVIRVYSLRLYVTYARNVLNEGPTINEFDCHDASPAVNDAALTNASAGQVALLPYE